MTDELQFGLKQNMSCSDAVFAVRSAVSYFIERDSCVYAATLDFKKAFNIVNPGFYPDAPCLGGIANVGGADDGVCGLCLQRGSGVESLVRGSGGFRCRKLFAA